MLALYVFILLNLIFLVWLLSIANQLNAGKPLHKNVGDWINGIRIGGYLWVLFPVFIACGGWFFYLLRDKHILFPILACVGLISTSVIFTIGYRNLKGWVNKLNNAAKDKSSIQKLEEQIKNSGDKISQLSMGITNQIKIITGLSRNPTANRIEIEKKQGELEVLTNRRLREEKKQKTLIDNLKKTEKEWWENTHVLQKSGWQSSWVSDLLPVLLAAFVFAFIVAIPFAISNIWESNEISYPNEYKAASNISIADIANQLCCGIQPLDTDADTTSADEVSPAEGQASTPDDPGNEDGEELPPDEEALDGGDTPQPDEIAIPDWGYQASYTYESEGETISVELADAIIQFNRGENGALIGYTPSKEIDTDTVILLPPPDIIKGTYLVEPGDSIQKIANCQTKYHQIVYKENCPNITTYDLIRANAKIKGINFSEFTIVTGQRIVFPTHPEDRLYLGDFPLFNIGVLGLAFGILVLVLALIIIRQLFSRGKGNILTAAFVSATGTNLSISKFQMWLWLLTFIFSYTAVSVIRAFSGNPDPMPFDTFPESLVILMGLSVATYSAARLIVTKQSDSTSALRTSESDEPSLNSLIEDYGGRTDITRLQLAAFTLLGVFFYVFRLAMVIRQSDYTTLVMPDVDQIIVALMLASQASYLAKRGTITMLPYIARIYRMEEGESLIITGSNLGNAEKTTEMKISVDGGSDISVNQLSTQSNNNVLHATQLSGDLPKGTALVKFKVNNISHVLNNVAIIDQPKLEIKSIKPYDAESDNETAPKQYLELKKEANIQFRLNGSFVETANTKITVFYDETMKQEPVAESTLKDLVKVKNLDLTGFKTGKAQIVIRQLDLDALSYTGDIYIGQGPKINKLIVNGSENLKISNQEQVTIQVLGENFSSDTKIHLQRIGVEKIERIEPDKDTDKYKHEGLIEAKFTFKGQDADTKWTIIANTNGWESEVPVIDIPELIILLEAAATTIEKVDYVKETKVLTITGKNFIEPVLIHGIQSKGIPGVLNDDKTQITCTLDQDLAPERYTIEVIVKVGLDPKKISMAKPWDYPKLDLTKVKIAPASIVKGEQLPRVDINITNTTEAGFEAKQVEVVTINGTPSGNLTVVDPQNLIATFGELSATETECWDLVLKTKDNRDATLEKAITVGSEKLIIETAHVKKIEHRVITLCIKGSTFTDEVQNFLCKISQGALKVEPIPIVTKAVNQHEVEFDFEAPENSNPAGDWVIQLGDAAAGETSWSDAYTIKGISITTKRESKSLTLTVDGENFEDKATLTLKRDGIADILIPENQYNQRSQKKIVATMDNFEHPGGPWQIVINMPTAKQTIEMVSEIGPCLKSNIGETTFGGDTIQLDLQPADAAVTWEIKVDGQVNAAHLTDHFKTENLLYTPPDQGEKDIQVQITAKKGATDSAAVTITVKKSEG